MNFKMRYLIFLLFFPFGCFAQYNFYYGNIHSHTEYSDGNKDSSISGVSNPAGSFAYAKGSYHVDFWGISEHNHYNATNNPGMLLPRYAAGLYQADTSNQNGLFVCMYGMEFGTISQGGHVVVYGSPHLFGWENVAGNPNYDVFCPLNDFPAFWSLVNSYPNAFVTLAHPQTHDYNELADGAPFSATADSVLVGSAIRSGDAFSTTIDYTDLPANSYEFRFRKCLAAGYHVGPAIDHDNHYTTFGRTVQGRTVVLAGALHRDSIMAAYKARRFYASDDWNTQVNYTLNGYCMGSNFTTASNANISLTVSDIDPGDNVSSIELHYGVPGSGITSTLLYSVNNTNTLNYTHNLMPGSQYYYYAKITQLDGDIIWTSPIWVQRDGIPLPITTTNFSAEIQDQSVQLSWNLHPEMEVENLVLEHSTNGIDYFALQEYEMEKPIQTDFQFLHSTPVQGMNYYRLRLSDPNKNITYSNSVTALMENKAGAQSVLYPNPATDRIHVSFEASSSAKGLARMYDANGRQVHMEQVQIMEGKNSLTYDVSCFATGNYYFVLQKENERLVDIQFIKK